MLFVGAAAAAMIAVPGLRRAVAVATARRPAGWPVAAAAVAAALLIAWRAEGALHAAALALVAAAGIAAGWIDAYERRLPDVLVLPAYPVVAALLIATGEADAMLRAAACAAAGMAAYGIGCAAGQVGFGDVKLAGLLGLALGWASWQTALIAAVATAAVGGGQAAVVLAMRRKDFPYGPAMLAGAAAALAFAPWLA
ncbi:prepilin peptidase [Glycomyces harbinensis]|uniref:Leader peptidase (Prepilin peptidase) / N-methyltransferase n=1 Tax=Glycomyces harbinensis TaxID=58114 RepID=A0A1G6WM67_9ACTN|nr:prepilin peptidase [Glycomyces harbinensis]SDD66938.1 leader peptidase (prepilin peptidase) / N-methyltransferase [Glycomyces harbinensis]